MAILLPSSMQHANALKVLFALLSNASGVVIFLASGRVNLPVAGIMMVASLVGGWIGAKVAQRLSPVAMRVFAVAIGLVAAGKFFFT
jgi:uncharacterized protein